MTRTTIARQLLGIALVALPLALANAQALPDPTRPPDAVLPGAGGEAGQAPSGLQTIIRRQGAKPAAVINGQYVELGGKVGDAHLVEVGESSVILQGPAGKEEMKLYPGVEKKAPAAAKAAKKVKRAKGAKPSAPARNNGEATK